MVLSAKLTESRRGRARNAGAGGRQNCGSFLAADSSGSAQQCSAARLVAGPQAPRAAECGLADVLFAAALPQAHARRFKVEVLAVAGAAAASR